MRAVSLGKDSCETSVCDVRGVVYPVNFQWNRKVKWVSFVNVKSTHSFDWVHVNMSSLTGVLTSLLHLKCVTLITSVAENRVMAMRVRFEKRKCFKCSITPTAN